MKKRNYSSESGFVFVAKSALEGILNFPDWNEIMKIENFPTGELAYSDKNSGKVISKRRPVYHNNRRKTLD